MFDPFRPKPANKRRFLLKVDSWLDETLFKTGCLISRFYNALCSFSERLRTRGFAKIVVELFDEAATFGTIGFLIALTLAIPAFNEIKKDWRSQQDYSVTFLDRYGKEIGKRGILLNDTVPLKEIPDTLIKATMATEDRRFFRHFGIDIAGTIRAMVENAKADGIVQGGSSLTQQLAKNLFLTNERKLSRKIKEAYLALWLEANLTKEEILKLYLDRAYMGGGAVGVAAAAEYYFGKDVRDLTLAESAMLAGLYKAPSKYAPHADLAAARARALEVLSNMVEAGFLTEGQVLAAKRNPATPINNQDNALADFFLDWVFEEAKTLAPQHQRIFTVRTTLDQRLQRASEAAIQGALRQYEDQYNVSQAASILMETDGGVRALVGGRDYGSSQFNRVTGALRQPGSSFKPIVYATAMMHNYTPRSVVTDAPICLGDWCPKNYTRKFAGPVTLTRALTKSINTIPVILAQRIGRDKIIDTAYKMGVTSELKITRALPLGVAGVTIMDMASVYAVLANGGLEAQPYGVLDIRDVKGNVLYSKNLDRNVAPRVLPEEAVSAVNQMMHNVVNAGTGRRARIEDISVAGKTGTTQSYRDAWFIGYTGNYVAAVWYGNDDYTPTARLTGGNLPAMTWQEIVSQAHQGIVPKPMLGVDANAIDIADQNTLIPSSLFSPIAQTRPASSLLPRTERVLKNIIQLYKSKTPISALHKKPFSG